MTPFQTDLDRSPRHSTAVTRSTSASGSPSWGPHQETMPMYDINNYSPILQDFEPYVHPDLPYESGQAFYGESWNDLLPPSNALLLSTNDHRGVDSMMFSSNAAHQHTASHRQSQMPRIQIDTGLTSATLNQLDSAFSASTPYLGQAFPYTPPSLSPNVPIVNAAHLSPRSPTSSYNPHVSPKAPYSPARYSSSPSSSISNFGELTVGGSTRQPQGSVCEIAKRFPGFERIVPQRTYRPNTQSDRRRYVEEVQLEDPIFFFVSNPDGLGISCRDALNSRFIRLCERDDQMFINRGPSVSIRINWPGYPPWSRQIPTRDFRTPPGPITRAKLAKNVAKTVDRFITEMSQKTMDSEEGDRRWCVGSHHITIDQLELVGLQHVSMGSWQAHLRVRAPAHTHS